MSSLPATMATAGVMPVLPDEIVIWEILVHLPPKPLLRCRAVCRAWRHTTSTAHFLAAHHAHQPALPVCSGFDGVVHGAKYHDILAFDHRAAADAQLHAVARLEVEGSFHFHHEASCDGLLLLSKRDRFHESGYPTRLFICNPATREQAFIAPPWNYKTLGMYPHRPTGEYRLLLKRESGMTWNLALAAEEPIGFYVFTLGSGQQPRYIGSPETSSGYFNVPAVLVRHSLHWQWYPEDYRCERKHYILVFDTIAESFRQMRSPDVPVNAYFQNIFEMDGTLGIVNEDLTGFIDIWVLHNYESEVWDFKCRIMLPFEEIRRKFMAYGMQVLDIVSRDKDVLLLISFGYYLFHVDSEGKLIGGFKHGCSHVNTTRCKLKQSLVQHTFFPSLDDYAMNTTPLPDSFTALE